MLANTAGLVFAQTPTAPRWTVFIYFALWLMLWLAGQYVLKAYRPGHDPFIFPIVMLLLGWGMLQVDRLAPSFALRHAAWCTLAVLVVIGVAWWPGKLLWLGRYPYTVMLIGLGVVGITFIFGTAPLGYGPRLWLKIPFLPVFFQPSELLKLLFVVFAAGFFSQRQRKVSFGSAKPSIFEIAWLGPLAAMWLFSMSLLVLQQDLGAATLLFFSFMALVYLSTGERLYVAGGIGLLIIAAVIATQLYDRVALRMEAVVNPWPDASDRAFQIVQALYAIGAGGVMGSGIGEGFPFYIPVVHSDYALAAIAEEWGMIGSFVVLSCFAVLIWRGFKIAIHVNHPFYRFLAAGITILIGTQTIMIVGGVAKLLPITGVTLPFVSYGGSSMMVLSLMVGLLLWISPQVIEQGRQVSRISPSIAHRLRRLNSTFVTGLAVLLVGLFWWGSVQADWLAEREDNPRRVEAELRIQRGAIYDRHENLLAHNIGTTARQEREVVDLAAAPVVGYTSLRFGSSAIEEGLDPILRGDGEEFEVVWPQVALNRPQIGSDVRLTVDSALQQMSMSALGEHAGAIVLMTTTEGAVRALASTPTFDPNQLDENFDALKDDESGPLVNRALQNNYQPGRILLPFLVAWGLEQSNLTSTIIPEDALANGDETLKLFSDWRSAELLEFWDAFGFNQIVGSLPMVQAEPTNSLPGNLTQAIAGDEALLVTPMQMANALAKLANQGESVTPQIISGIDQDGEWAAWEATIPVDGAEPVVDETPPVLNIGTAEAALDLLEVDQLVAGYAVEVEAGPDQTNSWFIGVAPPESPRFVVVIVLEDVESVEPAERIGRELLTAALDS